MNATCTVSTTPSRPGPDTPARYAAFHRHRQHAVSPRHLSYACLESRTGQRLQHRCNMCEASARGRGMPKLPKAGDGPREELCAAPPIAPPPPPPPPAVCTPAAATASTAVNASIPITWPYQTRQSIYFEFGQLEPLTPKSWSSPSPSSRAQAAADQQSGSTEGGVEEQRKRWECGQA